MMAGRGVANIVLKLIGLSKMSVWNLIDKVVRGGKILVNKLSYIVYYVISIIHIYDIILFICLNNYKILNKEPSKTKHCHSFKLMEGLIKVTCCGFFFPFCLLPAFINGLWEPLTLKRLNILIE